MIIPVELVNEGTDWPAWAQAIGSVAAIAAAIWIDQGSARRLRQAAVDRSEADRLAWLGAAEEASQLIGRAIEAARPQGHSMQELFTSDAKRLAYNAQTAVGMYYVSQPPTPRVGSLVATASSFVTEACNALSDFHSNVEMGLGMATLGIRADKCRERLVWSLEGITQALEEYRAGER
jgi:hypothetical protein